MTDTVLTEYYCTDCGSKDPWDERPAFRFEEGELPIVFRHEVYDDGNALWRSFVGKHFGDSELTGSQIAELPDEFPALKYCVFNVWFKITPNYNVKGPFLSEEEVREA